MFHLTDCKQKLRLDEEEEPPAISKSVAPESKVSNISSPPHSPSRPANPPTLPHGTVQSQSKDSSKFTSPVPLVPSPHLPPTGEPLSPLDVLFGDCDEVGGGNGEGGGVRTGERGRAPPEKVIGRELETTKGTSAPVLGDPSLDCMVSTTGLTGQTCVTSCTTVDSCSDLQAQVVIVPRDPTVSSKRLHSHRFTSPANAVPTSNHSSSQHHKTSDARHGVGISDTLNCGVGSDRGGGIVGMLEEEDDGGFWSQAAELVSGTWEDEDDLEETAKLGNSEFEETMADAFIDQVFFSGAHTGTTPIAKQKPSSTGFKPSLLNPNSLTKRRLMTSITHPPPPPTGSGSQKSIHVPTSSTYSSGLPSRHQPVATRGPYNYVPCEDNQSNRHGSAINSSFVHSRVRLIPGVVPPPMDGRGVPTRVHASRASDNTKKVPVFHSRERPIVHVTSNAVTRERKDGGRVTCSQSEIARKKEQAKLRLSQRRRQRGATALPNS